MILIKCRFVPLIGFILFNLPAFSQNIGINSTGASPATSALLDVDASPSNNKGILIPRVSLSATNLSSPITSPVTSLIVYNTATAGTSPNNVSPGYYYWDGSSWMRLIDQSQGENDYIPSSQYPSFDSGSPYLIAGALWVGYDNTAKKWKYNKQASGRGLTDPGDPSTWSVNGTSINYWNGDLTSLPSGTHINNRYYPPTMAAVYSQDDIQIRIGNKWIDKYSVTVVDCSSGMTIRDDWASFQGNDGDGSGQDISPLLMGFSQKRRGSTGMTWFAAQQIAINTGKYMITNAEYQAAAGGTAQSTGNSQVGGRDYSVTAPDAECSRFGCYGMAGDLWQWVADWGTFGADQAGFTQGESDVNWSSAYNSDVIYNLNSSGLDAIGWKNNLPGAYVRGGWFSTGTGAGIYCLSGNVTPAWAYTDIGFRCTR